MSKPPAAVAGALVLSAFLAPAQGAVTLFEYGVNIDGAVSHLGGMPPLDPVPPGMNVAGFDPTTGWGTVSITIGGAGVHNVDLYVDHEIDEPINTYFNEFGAATGAPAAGQSWEIDEPGFIFGDIFTNFQTSALDNTNAVPAGSPDDVAMALGWDFILALGEVAEITFLVAPMPPASGFYLEQHDTASSDVIYFSSELTIRSEPIGDVPEPATVAIWGLLGVASVGCYRAWQRRVNR